MLGQVRSHSGKLNREAGAGRICCLRPRFEAVEFLHQVPMRLEERISERRAKW
jgi:hypothetical protein